MHDMCGAALAGDHVHDAAINEKLMPLHLAMFVEANPIPVKWAVARLGLIGQGIRLPLTWLSDRLEDDVLAVQVLEQLTLQLKSQAHDPPGSPRSNLE